MGDSDSGDGPWPFKFALPFVGAIIEREIDGLKHVLLQTRNNPSRDPRYTGTIEFTAGILDQRFESVFEALKREIYEETGLKLRRLIDDPKQLTTQTDKDDSQQGFRPYYCSQQLVGDYPWIGFVFRCEVEDGDPRQQDSETKNPHWVSLDEVAAMLRDNPNQFFGLQLPALKFYIEDMTNSSLLMGDEASVG